MVSASHRREAVRYLEGHYPVSQRRACRVTGSARSAHRYVSRQPPQDALRRRIRELARSRVRYGYKRIHILLKREGIHVNKKRVHRLYCLEGLQLRAKRPRRHVSAATRQPPKTKPQAPNLSWSMDFVSDQTGNGQRFRALTIVDVFTRECLAVEPGQKLVAKMWHASCAGWLLNEAHRNEFTVITAASFPVDWPICGRMQTRSRWNFPGLGNRPTMPTLNRSMAAYEMNA